MFCSQCGSQNVQKITIKGQSYFQCDDCGHVGPVFARRSAGASSAARNAPAAKKKGSGLLGVLGLIAIVLALYHFLYGSGPDSKSTNMQTPAVAVETEQAPAVEQPDSAPSDPAPAETAAVSISAFASNGGSSDGGELVRSEPPAPQQAAYNYVLNTNTMRFHYPSCNDVSKIKPENYQSAHDSRENVIAQGYVPCGHCHP